MDHSHHRSVSPTHKVIPMTYTVFWSRNISKGAITKSTALSYTCLMVPTEPLGCQLYGRAPAKAITKSLHCFTHFLWHLDGPQGTVIIVMGTLYSLRYQGKQTNKQKDKGKKCKTNKQIPSITYTWTAPHSQVSEGLTPHLGITITSHSRNAGAS